jgi:hypothetical protein
MDPNKCYIPLAQVDGLLPVDEQLEQERVEVEKEELELKNETKWYS